MWNNFHGYPRHRSVSPELGRHVKVKRQRATVAQNNIVIIGVVQFFGVSIGVRVSVGMPIGRAIRFTDTRVAITGAQVIVLFFCLKGKKALPEHSVKSNS